VVPQETGPDREYCTHGTGWNPGVYAYILNGYSRTSDLARPDQDRAPKPVDSSAAMSSGDIFNAIFGDGTPFQFNGNVAKHVSSSTPSPGGCVEVPVWPPAGLER